MDKSTSDATPQSSSSIAVSNDTELNFGEYLSTQYALLEQTLSYLSIDDLFSALLVCKSWSQAVQNLFRRQRKINRIHWHVPLKSKDGRNVLNIKFKSQLILAFSRLSKSDFIQKELIERPLSNAPVTVDNDSTSSGDSDTRLKHPVSGLVGGLYLLNTSRILVPLWCAQSWRSPVSSQFKCSHSQCKNYGTSAVAIFFPEIEGCIVNSIFSTRHDHRSTITEKVLAPCAEKGSLKGIMVFEVVDDSDVDDDIDFPHNNSIVSSFNDILTNNNERRFAFGGGLFSNMRKCTGPSMECHEGFLLVCFYGENVRCHSAVLSISSFFREDRFSRLNNFMKETRDALGGINVKTQQRIAFVFRCSGIGPPLSTIEKRIYHEYFPDTPAFDCTTNGEYGISHFADSTDECVETKKSKLDTRSLQVHHTYSSVYFFVTVDFPA